jgi:hypothetical protein
VFAKLVTSACVVASVVTTVLLPRARWQSALRLVVWKRCLAPAFAFGVIGASVVAAPLALPSQLGWLLTGVDPGYLTTAFAARACHVVSWGSWLAGAPIEVSPLTVALEIFTIVFGAGAVLYVLHSGLRFSRFTRSGRAARRTVNS